MPARAMRSRSAIDPSLRNAQPYLRNTERRRFAGVNRTRNTGGCEPGITNNCSRSKDSVFSRQTAPKEECGESDPRMEGNARLASVSREELDTGYRWLGRERLRTDAQSTGGHAFCGFPWRTIRRREEGSISRVRRIHPAVVE